MSDESQDKKSTVPDVPSAKSHLADGVSAEFDRGAMQGLALSPEQQISGAGLPQLEPKYLQDPAPPNRHGGALATAGADAATQPSLRRVRQAMHEPRWRQRAVRGLLALLSLAVLWEVAALVWTSFAARRAERSESRTSIQISGAAPTHLSATVDPAQLKPEPAPTPAPELALDTARAAPAAPAPEVNSPPPSGQGSERPSLTPTNPAANAPRAPAVSPEASPAPKPEGADGPEPSTSSKAPSKVLFPPQ